jgi:RHS repeat-associated protein
MAESTIAGTITAEYVFLNSNPFAKIEINNVYYYHDDHLRTPRKMTNNSGAVMWYGEFLPFGELLSVTGTITNNFRFPGQYYDEETGLHYNWWRDYHASTGRYLTFDPALTKSGNPGIPYLTLRVLNDPFRLNPYSYAGDNPPNLADPSGLACGTWWNDWLVPDDWPTYSFGACCKEHDDCYGCLGKQSGFSKSDCDEGFCNCMLKVCDGLDGYSRQSCEGNAKLYCKMVKKHGDGAFKNGRM